METRTDSVDSTQLTTLGTLLAAVLSAFFAWRGIKAQTRVERDKVTVERVKSDTDSQLAQQRLLTEQANKLRDDLLKDNVELKGDLRDLRQRVEQLEDRNAELRAQLRDCLEKVERPTDARGTPQERRRRE